MKKIQAAAAGFGGSPVTLYSAYDPETGVLVLAALKAHTTERQAGCTFISNSSRSEYDVLFTDDQLRSAIKAYYELRSARAADGSDALAVSVEGANPMGAVQIRAVDERGVQYEVNPGITNAQVAALATCLFVQRQRGPEAALEFMKDVDEINTLLDGCIVTI